MPKRDASGHSPSRESFARWRDLKHVVHYGFEAAPRRFTAHIFMNLLGGVIPVLTGWLVKAVLDRLNDRAALGSLIAVALALAAMGIIQAFSQHAITYLRAELERVISIRVQGQLFSSVNGFVGLRRFEDPHFLDRLRLASQSGRRSTNDVVDGALGLLRAIVTAFGFLASLMVIAPVMACFLVAFAVPVLKAEISMSRQRADMMLRITPRERREIFYDQMLTTADAAKEVRLFGIGGFLLDRMQSERRSADNEKREIDRREFTVQSALAVVSAVIAGAGLVWAIYTSAHGSLSLGDVSIFIAAVAGVQSSATGLAAESARVHQAISLFGHYREIVDLAPDLTRALEPVPVPKFEVGVEFRDVWFRYAEDQPWVLKGVNLVIPKGASVGLVGINGAGKSTLVKLLCRFYDPCMGSILWNGVDLRHMSPEEYRQHIGAVFQDYMSYDLTVRENIGIGSLESLHEMPLIEEAAMRAGVHDLIMDLPRQYETPVTRIFFHNSEDSDEASGVLLSGGQSQRLALARGLLRNDRDFMILDEPSSSLDAEAEYDMQVKLGMLRKGKTSLLISHRLGSLRDADKIAVLSQGEVREEGSHDELIAKSGEYARLFALQSSGYHDAPGSAMERMNP